MDAPPADSDDGKLRCRPKQTRSVETCNALMEAAAKVFSEQGYDATTTHDIARAAGVSVGALYRYFADKQALIVALYRSEISDLQNRVVREFSILDLVGRDMHDIVRKTLALVFGVYAERPGLRRVLSEQSRRIPELAALRRDQERALDQTVGQILRSVQGVRLPDIEVGAYLVRLFFTSLIDDYVLYPPPDAAIGRERVLDAAADFILRYALGQM